MKILTIILALALVAGPAAAGQWPHERDGFMIGFNIGGGSATAKVDDSESDSGGGGAGSFRLGWAFANQFVVGFGAGHEWRLTRTFALGAAVDYNTVDLDLIDFHFTNFTAQLNWYF